MLHRSPRQRNRAWGATLGGVTAPDVRFRPLRDDDLPMLVEWLSRPHVAAWWGPAGTIDQLRADYLLDDGPHATRAFVAALDGAPIGFVQRYVVMGAGGGWWEDETDPGAHGIDGFLADGRSLGHGLGRSMVAAFVAALFDDPAVTVVQADPDPRNERAIRCYAAAGFRPVGIVTTPEGPALLMRSRRDDAPTLSRTRRPGTRR